MLPLEYLEDMEIQKNLLNQGKITEAEYRAKEHELNLYWSEKAKGHPAFQDNGYTVSAWDNPHDCPQSYERYTRNPLSIQE